mgnify:CR=1 FL=1
MCGQPTAYNTYATLPYTNPLFMGFSCSQNVNKEIIKSEFTKSQKIKKKPANAMIAGFLFISKKI